MVAVAELESATAWPFEGLGGGRGAAATSQSRSEPEIEGAEGRAGGWLARLELNFRRLGARTVVDRGMSLGPLAVQRPFREPDGGSHVYLLHPPGGLVAGDRLHLSFRLQDGAQALVTAPGATKVYRSGGSGWAHMSLQARLEGRAVLEWLPLETIAFEEAQLSQTYSVELGAEGQFIGWEVLCLGRHSAGLKRGRLRQRWALRRLGKPLWSEVNDLRGGDPVLVEPWGLGSASVIGTLVATGAGRDALDAIRQLLASSATVASATLVGEVLLVRFLGDQSGPAKQLFGQVWALLRSLAYGRRAYAPRVWAT